MDEWRNWAGDQACRPAAFERLADRDGVAAAVARARGVVRVAGAGHSFTDAVPTNGTLLSLERMDRVLDVDRSSGLVRAQAGITLRALSERLLGLGLALANLGDIDVQSVAGATATATHGTGARLKNLSAAIRSVELVLADGSVIEVDGGDDLLAARVSLGALGVITALTLQAVPAFTLEGVDAPAQLEETLERLDELAAANEHFELFTFPHSPLALTRTNNRTDAPPRPRRPRVAWLQDFASPRLVRFTEMEYAIPREHLAAAVRAVRTVIDERGFAVPYPLEVRCVAGDDALLSPAGGRDTGYVAVHMYRGMEWEPCFRAGEAILDGFGGRPHWGKRHFQTADSLRGRYPGWERFATVRDRLDPGRRFANAHVRRVLGP